MGLLGTLGSHNIFDLKKLSHPVVQWQPAVCSFKQIVSLIHSRYIYKRPFLPLGLQQPYVASPAPFNRGP